MAANLSFRGWARAGGNLSWNQETPTADRFMERQVGLGGPLCAAVSLRGDVDFRLADSPVAPPADERPAPAETKQSPPAAGPAPDSPTPTGTGVPPAQRTGTAGEESAGVVNTGYKVKVDVDLVHLNVSVRERATNRSVPDLQRDDFEVLEDGVRQTIGRFEPTEAPFHLLLLLDVSGSTQEFLDLIKEASVQFTRQINAQDRIAVAAFNSRLRLHQEFSNDREEIRQSINRIRSGGGTAFYDALAGCLEQHLRHIEGRKAVVVFTDGVDNQLAGNPADGSYITFNQLYRKIEESDSLVYTIFLDAQDGVQRRPTSGRRPPGGIGDILGDILKGRIPSRSPGGAGPDADVRDEARRQLEMIADQTGGRMYYPRRIEDLDDAYSEIADDLRVQYALAYNSTNAERDGKWRKVEVSVLNRPDVAVRTRKGYYAGQPAGASRKLVNRNGG
jgi:VWFA-related protein